jgi:hypothetical protein
MPLGTAIAVFCTFASGLMILMLLMLPETRGRSLTSLEAEAVAGTTKPPGTVGQQEMTR